MLRIIITTPYPQVMESPINSSFNDLSGVGLITSVSAITNSCIPTMECGASDSFTIRTVISCGLYFSRHSTFSAELQAMLIYDTFLFHIDSDSCIIDILLSLNLLVLLRFQLRHVISSQYHIQRSSSVRELCSAS